MPTVIDDQPSVNSSDVTPGWRVWNCAHKPQCRFEEMCIILTYAQIGAGYADKEARQSIFIEAITEKPGMTVDEAAAECARRTDGTRTAFDWVTALVSLVSEELGESRDEENRTFAKRVSGQRQLARAASSHAEKLEVVRQILASNPGISMRKAAPLIRARCGVTQNPACALYRQAIEQLEEQALRVT